MKRVWRAVSVLMILFMNANILSHFIGASDNALVEWLSIYRAYAANRYYVATTGDDSRSCETATNINTPRRTIGAGASCIQSSSGDVVDVRGGTYTDSNDRILTTNTNPGSSWANAAVIRSYPGETVIIKPTHGNRVVELQGAATKYIIIEGIIFDGIDRPYLTNAAVHIGEPNTNDDIERASFIRVDGIMVRNWYYTSLEAYGNSSQILRSTFKDARGQPGEVENHYGWYVAGEDNVFEYNHIENYGGFGVHNFCNTSPCAGGHGPNRSVYRYNTIKNVGYSLINSPAAMYLSSGDDIRAENNLIIGAAVTGIGIGHSARRTRVLNNTVVNSGFAGISYGPQFDTYVANNILWNNALNWFDYNGYAIGRENNRCNNAGDVVGCSMFDDPGFVNSGANNFRLGPNSPMKNAGIDVGLPCSGACAIGAFDPPEIK